MVSLVKRPSLIVSGSYLCLLILVGILGFPTDSTVYSHLLLSLFPVQRRHIGLHLDQIIQLKPLNVIIIC